MQMASLMMILLRGDKMEESDVRLTKDETDILLQYIDFMNEFDDDPTFRDHALSAEEKLKRFA